MIEIYIDLYLGSETRTAKFVETWTTNTIPRVGEHIQIDEDLYYVYHIVYTRYRVKLYIKN